MTPSISRAVYRLRKWFALSIAAFVLAACGATDPHEAVSRASLRIDVMNNDADQSIGHGTAFAISDHYWATAAHVVGERDFFEIGGIPARVVFRDAPNDTAILYRPLPHGHWLDVDCSYAWPETLTHLITYGYANAGRRDMRLRAIFHDGIVATDFRQPINEGYRYVITGASIVPGASGSAWVDDDGVVRGIVTNLEAYMIASFMGAIPMLTDTSLAAPTFALCSGMRELGLS